MSEPAAPRPAPELPLIERANRWRQCLCAHAPEGVSAPLFAFFELDSLLFTGALALDGFRAAHEPPLWGEAARPPKGGCAPQDLGWAPGQGLVALREAARADLAAMPLQLAGALYPLALREATGPRPRGRGRSTGAFYTPDPLGQELAEAVAPAGAPAPLRVLDPACGAGALLQAVAARLMAQGLTPGDVAPRLAGIDSDPRACALARRALFAQLVAAGAEPEATRAQLISGVRWADALLPEGAGCPPLDVALWLGEVDAIVANPPFLFARSQGIAPAYRAALRARYGSAAGQLATYPLFVEAALGWLAPQGVLAFILPVNHMSVPSLAPFRRRLLEAGGAPAWVLHRYPAFAEAQVDTCIFTLRGGAPAPLALYASDGPGHRVRLGAVAREAVVPEAGVPTRLAGEVALQDLLLRLEAGCVPLGQVARVRAGLKAYEVGKGQPAQDAQIKALRSFHSPSPLSAAHRPYVRGRDVTRYALQPVVQWLRYGRWLAAPRDASVFEGRRVLIRQIPSAGRYAIHACLAEADEVHDVSVMALHAEGDGAALRLLGLLCSLPLTVWFHLRLDKMQRRRFPQFKVAEVLRFPIPPGALGADSALGRRLEQLVEARLRSAGAEAARLDTSIDEVCAHLYGVELLALEGVQA